MDFETPLPREFYTADTLTVARQLLGKHLVRRWRNRLLVGRIVETEAYLGPEDQAAHSARGLTARNAAMFGPAGHAYVYLIYGMWHCVNVVTAETGTPHAVLIRALEPVLGIADKTCGPGLLCRAMHISRAQDKVDLSGNTLWIAAGSTVCDQDVACAARIGVDYAGDWAHRPWRFYLHHSPWVSTAPASLRRLRVIPAI